MVYLAGDNNLQASALADINQMEAAPSSPLVRTVVQVDTMTTTARRLEIASEGVFNGTIVSPVIDDLGEIDTADPDAIEDFVAWAVDAYPADNHVLVLWDHGGSWGGFASDETSGSGAIGFTALKAMLQNIRASYEAATGAPKLDLIGFDACLMAAIEIDQILAPAADFRVASCEVESGPITGSGWNYIDPLTALAATPGMSVADFARQICNDTLAMKNASGVTNQTMSAVDLSATGAVLTAVGTFASALLASPAAQLWSSYAPARRSATEYGRMSQQAPGYFIDLRAFAADIAATSTAAPVVAAASALVGAIDAAVIRSVQGTQRPDHGGLSIYHPNCLTCDPAQPEYRSTVDIALGTQWDEWFVAYQTLLSTDTTPPVVTINTPADNTVFSLAAPATINVTLAGNDLARVSAWINPQIGPTTFAILGSRDLPLTPGASNVPQPATTFAVSNGPVTQWLCALSLAAGTNLYLSNVQYTPPVGPVRILFAVTSLNYATGTGSLLGLLDQTAGGELGSFNPVPGSSLNFRIPVYDSNTGALGYLLQPQAMVMPAAGVSALTIGVAALPSGPYDIRIIAEDYAENSGSDTVRLVVP